MFKQAVFKVKTGILLDNFVRHQPVVTCRGNAETDFCISYGMCTTCKPNAYVRETLNQIPDKAFLSKYPLLCQLLPKKRYIESILSYLGIPYRTLDQRQCLRSQDEA